MAEKQSDVNPITTKPGQITRWTPAQRAGLANDPKRQKRLNYLVKAYVHYQGDMEALKEGLGEEKLKALCLEDPWFAEIFEEDAAALLEEAMLLNMVEMALSKTNQTVQVGKVILPALNKRRYNQQVQKQEVANEGIQDAMNLMLQKPLNRADLIATLQHHDPKLIEMKPEDFVPLTLEEAVAAAKSKGQVIDVEIEEDEDLK